MEDVEYVRSVLAGDFRTALDTEIPYPDLRDVISGNDFNFLQGTIEGEVPNGSKSREGHDYLWFQHGKKSILSHRFIAALCLGKWIPRDLDVDHINHNPSDNRPSNLRIVTRRDNVGNRRKAQLSDLVNLSDVAEDLAERKPTPERHRKKPVPVEQTAPLKRESVPDFELGGTIPKISYTGETKPAKYGGNWHKTNLGSWHLIYD